MFDRRRSAPDRLCLGGRTPSRSRIGVGLAPFDRESGAWKGKRSCFGGRARVRSTLRMAVITAKRCNPIIKTLARRLAAQGKPFKVVMAARARKLLTILNTLPATGNT